MDGVRQSHAGPGEALEAAEVVAGGGTQHHRRLEVLPLLPRWPPALLQQYPFGGFGASKDVLARTPLGFPQPPLSCTHRANPHRNGNFPLQKWALGF